MRLKKARVTKYRSVRDSGWFEIDEQKTILVGPNEAGKTAVLEALQRLNAPKGIPGFNSLRDYPRSELNDLDSGRVKPADVTVVEGVFTLDEDDRGAVSKVSPDFADCAYVRGVRLDNTVWERLDGSPAVPALKDIEKDARRLAAHADKRAPEGTETPTTKFDAMVKDWTPETAIQGDVATKARAWLKATFPLVSEGSQKEHDRHDRLVAQATVAETRGKVIEALRTRLPVFVYFSNYFRVHPRIHLEHLAQRIEQNVLDDAQYDFGNTCLLKLLAFSARELSNLGKAGEPAHNDAAAVQRYRDQLDKRSYKLNAASVQLTEHIKKTWNPDAKKDEAQKLRVTADQQYLKVVVEDELGVEIELDQRSEGFRWLVSFFVVFFAETADKYRNAILLLDEPGMSLHGLKQREFRKTVSRLGEENQLLFTTHSPFLVGPDELDRVRVVQMLDRRTGTKVHTTVVSGDAASLLPLQEALGYDLAQSLFAQERNLVLEGLTDFWYLEAMAQMLRAAGLSTLNENIALVPAATAGKVVYFATILHAHELKVAALLDSDAAGDQAATQDTLVHTLGNKRILRTKDAYKGQVSQPEIEDLLRETLLRVAKSELQWDATRAAAQQVTRPIADVFAASVGSAFSKYKLAKAFLRWSRSNDAAALTETERDQWVKLMATVNSALA